MNALVKYWTCTKEKENIFSISPTTFVLTKRISIKSFTVFFHKNTIATQLFYLRLPALPESNNAILLSVLRCGHFIYLLCRGWYNKHAMFNYCNMSMETRARS